MSLRDALAGPPPPARGSSGPSGRLGIGIHPNIPEDFYHTDPCETPSASSSILKTIIEQSPMHARWMHPRLNPDFEYTAGTDAQNAGTILHSIILGTPCPYRVLDFDSFRKDAAKDARDNAIADHLIPILADKLPPLMKVAQSLRARILTDFPEIGQAIEASQKEVSIVWAERGALCRCRFDLLPPAAFGFALDLKFTGLSAEPETWGKRLLNNHMFQAALYPRSVKSVRGDDPEFRFVVCETDPPYGVSVHAMDPQMQDLADRKVNRALAMWQECLATDKWPGYSTETHYHEPPPWELARWGNREYRDSQGSRETPGQMYARLADVAGGPPQ